MRIGIFGGSFDPPHNGHLALAQACMFQLELDEVLFLPAARNPFKPNKTRASGKQRMDMLKLMVDQDSRFSLSDMELTRGGFSYTVDTLGELQMVRPAEYWFLMGTDSLKGLPDWKNPQRLLRLCRLGVVVRNASTPAETLLKVPEVFRSHIDPVSMTQVDVSSTEIRDRIDRGLPIAPYLPAGVAKYIEQNKLYR